MAIGFLPDSLSFEIYIQRTLLVLPALVFFTALGLISTYTYLVKNFPKFNPQPILYILSAGVMIVSLVLFWDAYFIHQRIHQPWHRQGWAHEFITTLNQLAPQYPQTVIARDSHILYLFNEKVEPQEAQQLLRGNISSNGSFNSLTKYKDYLFMPNDCPLAGKLDVLYVCNGEKIPFNSKVQAVIRYPSNVPAKIFITFTEPTAENSLTKGDRISIMEDTIKDPKILSDEYPGYW